MITVGFGDISPKNSAEMLWCVLMMIISCGVFGYSLNQIGNIVLELKEHTKVTREALLTINNFMEKKKINNDL